MIAANTTTNKTAVTKAGTGTWVRSGANTYTGITTLSAGTLSVNILPNGGAAGSLRQSSNAAANLVFGGGTLLYTGATQTSDRAFTIDAGVTATANVSQAGTILAPPGRPGPRPPVPSPRPGPAS